jgi:hypothetical protein
MLVSPTKGSDQTTLMRALLLPVVLLLTACGEAITAPPAIDPEFLKVALPAVEDARVRISQMALEGGDAHEARYHVHLVATILHDYRATQGALMRDGPDVGGIALALHHTSMAVGGEFNISQFR